jgi:D-aspartate ligase
VSGGPPTPPVVLLGGLENALSVARSLARRGVEVQALEEPGGVMRHSRSCRLAVPFEGDVVAGWLEWLQTRARPGTIVVPCSDNGLELFVEHLAHLEDWGLAPIEADPRALRDVLDKQRTYEIARAAGVAAPRTVPLAGVPDLERAVEEIGLPAALKPLHIHEYSRHFRGKVVLADDLATLREALLRAHAVGVDMLLTEIIPGGEDRYCSYFTYLDEAGRPLFHFTKRKLRQYPVGFGGGTYHLTEWADDVAEAGLAFLQAARVRGLGNVEFKRDPRDGRLKIIECNARFTGGNEIVRVAGLDLAWFVYARMTGRPLPPVDQRRDGVRMWYPVQDTLAFLHARRAGKLTLRAWLGSLLHRQTFPVWSVRDPLPSLVLLGRMPLNGLRRRARRGRAATPEREPEVLAS